MYAAENGSEDEIIGSVRRNETSILEKKVQDKKEGDRLFEMGFDLEKKTNSCHKINFLLYSIYVL